jgi:hypothetical protein
MQRDPEYPLKVSLVPLHAMPTAPIWTRLGYREQRAERDQIIPKYQPMIDRWLRETQVRLFSRKARLQIGNEEVMVDHHRFHSRLVQERCAGAKQVYLLGASARPEDIHRWQTLQELNQLEEAVVLDAVLSEKVDYALDFLEQEINQELRRAGQVLGPRLSCGYGDFALENQGYFYGALDFSHYGITLTPQYLLIPEKTVTALAPVRQLEVRT